MSGLTTSVYSNAFVLGLFFWFSKKKVFCHCWAKWQCNLSEPSKMTCPSQWEICYASQRSLRPGEWPTVGVGNSYEALPLGPLQVPHITGALTLASTEVRFTLDSETNSPTDCSAYHVSFLLFQLFLSYWLHPPQSFLHNPPPPLQRLLCCVIHSCVGQMSYQ